MISSENAAVWCQEMSDNLEALVSEVSMGRVDVEEIYSYLKERTEELCGGDA